MPSSPVTKVVEHLRKTMLRREEDTLSDGQLMARFLEKRDEDAFAALVRRHGPMVWGVCLRIVGHADDAEDAFQAAFLVLVRKAAAVKPREAVGNWLYGVACHTALNARTACTRVRAKEKQVTSMPEPAKEPRDDREELQRLLDQELSALPDKYRLPVVLCDLEGRTRKEVAAQLKIPEGTLSSRLATAHQRLAKRLARHGLAVSGGSLAALFAQNAASACVPASVVSSTIKTATLVAASNGAVAGVVSTKVAALTEGVMKAMLLTKLKIATFVLLGATLVATGIGAAALSALQAKPTDRSGPAVFLGGDHVPKKAEVKTDQELLQGKWEVTEVLFDSKPQDGFQEVHALFDKDKMSLIGKEGKREFSFKLDPSKKPKAIDMTALDGELKGDVNPQIYQLEGDTLKLCWWNEPGNNKRPTEFASKEGSKLLLMTFTRAKPNQEPKQGKADAPKPADSKLLEGSWKVVALESDGKKAPPESLKGMRYSFKGSEVQIADSGEKASYKTSVKLDSSKTPKHIDLVVPEGPEKGKTMQGIFKFEKDRLVICLRGLEAAMKGRPNAFMTQTDSGLGMITLERVKE